MEDDGEWTRQKGTARRLYSGLMSSRKNGITTWGVLLDCLTADVKWDEGEDRMVGVAVVEVAPLVASQPGVTCR